MIATIIVIGLFVCLVGCGIGTRLIIHHCNELSGINKNLRHINQSIGHLSNTIRNNTWR